MTVVDYYQGFATRVDRLCADLRTLLTSLKAGGSTIAAYGAAAKGATLCNYADIDSETVDFVADRNVHKQGRYMPGVRIPIVDPAVLLERRPDYCCCSPGTSSTRCLPSRPSTRSAGGRFVVPGPVPRVVAAQA